MTTSSASSIDLKSLLKTLKKHLLILVSVVVVATVMTAIFVSLFVPKKYQSYVTLSVWSKADVSASIDNSFIVASENLAKITKSLFEMNSCLELVAENAGEDFTRGQIQSMSRISTDSVYITITVTAYTPEDAYALTEAYKLGAMESFREMYSNAGSIKVVNKAELYSGAVYPNVGNFTVLAALASFALTYLICFLVDFFNDAVKPDDDLSEVYEYPVLADVIDFNAKPSRSYGYAPKNSYGSGTKFSFAEAFNTIRTNLLFATGASQRYLIVMTSCSQSEGKSLTLSNIAVSFANSGYRVLLIDADMRKPVVHKLHKLSNREGLSSYLAGMAELKDVLKKDVSKNLDVITAGPIPPNPSELIASESMQGLLAGVTKAYDFVFVDTPPVNIVSDTILFAKYDAGILFVVRENGTTYPEISEALEKIRFADGKILGFIRTFCEIPSRKYYNGKYATRYGERPARSASDSTSNKDNKDNK